MDKASTESTMFLPVLLRSPRASLVLCFIDMLFALSEWSPGIL